MMRVLSQSPERFERLQVRLMRKRFRRSTGMSCAARPAEHAGGSRRGAQSAGAAAGAAKHVLDKPVVRDWGATAATSEEVSAAWISWTGQTTLEENDDEEEGLGLVGVGTPGGGKENCTSILVALAIQLALVHCELPRSSLHE